MLRRIRNTMCLLSILAGLALVAFWIRSHKRADRLHGSIWGEQSYMVSSKKGSVTIIVLRWSGAKEWWRRESGSDPVDERLFFVPAGIRQSKASIGFGWLDRPTYWVRHPIQPLPDNPQVTLPSTPIASLQGEGPIVPHWFLVLLAAAVAGLARMRWPPQFSLRTLLVAVTIVAFVLALETALGH